MAMSNCQKIVKNISKNPEVGTVLALSLSLNRRAVSVFFLIFCGAALFAQQSVPAAAVSAPEAGHPKYALVIGNGNYTRLNPLANPVNDAEDIAAALESLGFTVDKVLNATLDQMESASLRLKDRLGQTSGAYGFFYYAGHGVQSAGENYLVPIDANIPSEGYLRTRALSIQAILDDLNEARNSLNVVVLDACRDIAHWAC